jgi:hypothetical protein
VDVAVARHVLRGAFRASRELQELLPALKAECGAEEYDAWLKAIATTVAEIGLSVTNKATDAHPELEAEIEAQIERYGAYL